MLGKHSLSLRAAAALAFACLSAAACAHETRERPVQSTPTLTATASPAPLPSTAFRSDEEQRAPQSAVRDAPASRFETRRIGAGDEAPARRFRGATVDLDLKGADLTNVFRLLAEVGHVNIVVGSEVTGTITLRLRHVPWDQALDVIARARGLVLEREGNIILVRTGG